MEFIQLKCPIPREFKDERGVHVEPCGSYLCDIEVGKPTTMRFTCRQKHAEGHTNRIEFTQDQHGVVLYRELPADEKKSYAHDNGVRIPATEEEIAV